MGTPQGSTIGQHFFLLYMNNLLDCIIEANIFLYSDDCTIALSSPSAAEVRQKVDIAITQFSNWYQRNNLQLNSEKKQNSYSLV